MSRPLSLPGISGKGPTRSSDESAIHEVAVQQGAGALTTVGVAHGPDRVQRVIRTGDRQPDEDVTVGVRPDLRKPLRDLFVTVLRLDTLARPAVGTDQPQVVAGAVDPLDVDLLLGALR
jgi:hypothetical protein